jgi:hypothetical protein
VTIGLDSPIRESRLAVRRSSELRAWHATLVKRHERSIATTLEACNVSFGLKQDQSQLSLRYVFYLRANIGENSRLALWRDHHLLVHPELAERAQMLVRLGDTFDAPEVGSRIVAGFEDPTRAALTLIRAADRVLEFDLRLDDLVLSYDHRSRS